LYQFFWIAAVQIQTRHVKDYIGKENTTISLRDWKIIMFENCKIDLKSFNLLFTYQIWKVGHQKHMRIKGLTCITPIKLWFLKIYSQNYFLNEFIMWFFSLRCSVSKAHFQEPSTLRKVKIAVDTLAQHFE